jgi:hypothetical protein
MNQYQDDPGKGLNIASMVLGIISLVLMFWAGGIGVIPAIIGLVLGVVGKDKSREVGAPTGMATAGIVCSIVALVTNIAVTILCLGCLGCVGSAIRGGLSGLNNMP